MEEEIRRGSIVIHKDSENEMTFLHDSAEFKKFKAEVLKRLDNLEKDIEKLNIEKLNIEKLRAVKK